MQRILSWIPMLYTTKIGLITHWSQIYSSPLHGFANFGNVLFNLIGSMMMDFLKNLFFLFMIMSFSRTLSVVLKNQLNDMKQTDPKLIQGMKLLYFHNPYVLISLEAIWIQTLSKRFWTKVTNNRKWFIIKHILFIS